ncbi:MAG: hypothetical protein WED04_08625 [Promethearchaeati archaeon SRVP18_Atabeyarchaeia-1]
MSEAAGRMIAGNIVQGIKKAGAVLGPGYVQLAARYSTAFFAKLIGQTPPEVKDIDEALEYAIGNMKIFMNGYEAFAYGALKAESTIQGATGSVIRMVAKTSTAHTFEEAGFGKALGKASTAPEALRKYYSSLVKLGSMREQDLKFTDSGAELKLDIDNCPFADACLAAVAEGIPKILGGHECVRILAFATIIEVMTGRQQDYKLTRLSPPKCGGTILQA